ncbi:MAG: polysaccharide biosynthesis C-terminal domain-containing protein [Peptococcaceae bacterium]|nr:polysaccharide biosynthesis C-terminal domain-containing protein [Clostridia bacterium]MBQ7025172.1 polysaccharide biosynthesis C-terminal domain-containing protein [Peptococcaceae bacterium]
MSNKKSNQLVTNVVFNIVYHISLVILPLITTPYIARVLGSHETGVYSYTHAMATWFVLVARFGFGNYGNRQIAATRDNREQLNKTFTSIFVLQMVTGSIAVIAYIVYLIFFCDQYMISSVISGLYVLSAMFDIGWLFFGLEEFKLITIRTMTVRFISTACIFLFVKSQEDTWKYVLILAMNGVINTCVLWAIKHSRVSFTKVTLSECTAHIKGSFILFIPIILIDIYRLMDKAMLGQINAVADIGYYTYADRIVELPYSIIAAVGTVMLPRMTNLVATGHKNETLRMIGVTLRYNTIAAVAMIFGLIAVADSLVAIYLGPNFNQTVLLLQIMTPMILFRSWANVVRTQYLMPNKQDKSYIKSLCVGVVVNLVLNSILIPKYRAGGAAIATLFAESSVAMVQVYESRREIPVWKYIRQNLVFLLYGAIMWLVVCLTKRVLPDGLMSLIILIGVGGATYCFLIGLHFYKDIIGWIRRKRCDQA